jgi:phosphoglycerol transferase
MIIVFLLLLYRSMGLLPIVMADEWEYSLHSRLLPLAVTARPFYLYLWLFRHTNYCGCAYLQCARVFNCVLFVGAAPFIYKTARQVTTSRVATLVALLSIAAPVNTYTAYYMPEAMYFAGFWVLSWFLFAFRRMPPYSYGFWAGIILAGMSMIKVHGIFLFPAVALLVIALALRSHASNHWRDLVVSLGCLILGFAVVRFSLGFVFAGKAGLHLVGTTYGAIAGSSLNLYSLLRLSRQVPYELAGHCIALALLFGVPLVAAFPWDWLARKDFKNDTLFLIKVYTLAVLLPLLIIAVYFGAAVAGGPSPYESIRRMPARYYNFALPLLLIIAAGELSAIGLKIKRPVSVSVAVVMGLLAIAAAFLLPTHYSPFLIDCPEFSTAVANPISRFLIAALGISALGAWAADRRLGARLFLFLVVPATVLLSTGVATRELRNRMNADVYDRAGILVRQVLPAEDFARTVVVGPEEADIFRTIFQIDSPATRMLVTPASQPLNAAKIPSDADWVVLIGDYQLPPGSRIQYPMAGVQLFNRANQDVIHFSRPLLPGFVRKISGLSVPELIGRWSDAKQVEIEMSSPLPRSFQLKLTAGAFGPNVNLPFVVRIGSAVQSIRLSGTMADLSLPFVTDGNQRIITIEVPKPTAPIDIGFNRDTRHIGILLRDMTIAPSQ